MNKLTIEDLLKENDYFERGQCPICDGKKIYDALKDTMRENEKLWNAIRDMSKLIPNTQAFSKSWIPDQSNKPAGVNYCKESAETGIPAAVLYDNATKT